MHKLNNVSLIDLSLYFYKAMALGCWDGSIGKGAAAERRDLSSVLRPVH